MIERRSDILVMRALLKEPDGLILSALQKKTNLNYHGTKQAVNRLQKKNLVLVETHGSGEIKKIHIIKANFNHPKIEALKQILLESVIPEDESKSARSES